MEGSNCGMNGLDQVIAAEEFAESHSGTEIIGYGGTVLAGQSCLDTEKLPKTTRTLETDEEKERIHEFVFESVL
jgi:hypothetical protein